jgi:hypothetical protein
VSICRGSSLNGRQHPAGTGPGRGGTGLATMLGFGPIPQVVTREQGISSASTGPRPSAVGVLVVPVAGGEVDDGLVGQLGVRTGPRPVWAATSILLAATRRASWPSHTKSDRTFGTLHCGSAAQRRIGASGHRVQASHGVPISTIPAQAGPSAESGLTGPGLRGLAEVLVKATARSLRAESLPAKTRKQPASAGCVRYGALKGRWR